MSNSRKTRHDNQAEPTQSLIMPKFWSRSAAKRASLLGSTPMVFLLAACGGETTVAQNPGNGDDTSDKTDTDTGTTTPTPTATPVAELLTVKDNAGIVGFGGPATGDITINWAGTPGSSEALFTRQEYTSETGVDFSSSKTINLLTTQTLSGSAANLNALNITSAGTVTVTASAGDQSIAVSGGTVKAAMGDGTDSFDFGAAANVTIADEFDGGNGNDTVEITADNDATGAIFDDAGAKFEVLKINDGTSGHNVKVTLDFASADTLVRTIDASDMDASTEDFTLVLDTAGNVDGALTIKASAGKNIIAGGDGDDTADFGVTSITAADEINLGSGTDEVKITALGTDATTPVDMVFDNAGAGWEKLTISPSTATVTFDSKVSLDFTSADTVAREIDASALVAATQIFTLELGTAANVDGALTVTGGAGADVITTGDGADTVKGGAGADTLNGGSGSDTLDLSDLVIGANDGGVAINVSGADITGSAGTLEFSKGDATTAYVTLANGKVAYTGDASEDLNTDIDTVSNFEIYKSGDGNDRFYGASGSETYTAGDGDDFANAGTGADILNMGDGADTVVIDAGDTVLTTSLGDVTTLSSVSGFDTVSGLVRSDGTTASEVLDLVGSGTIISDTVTATDLDARTVYVDGAGTTQLVGSMDVTDGIASFFASDDGSGTAIVASAVNLAGIIDALQLVDFGSGGDTLAFAYDNTGDGTSESLMVFQQGDDAGLDSNDILVLLEGQGATDALIITTNTAGANDLFIA